MFVIDWMPGVVWEHALQIEWPFIFVFTTTPCPTNCCAAHANLCPIQMHQLMLGLMHSDNLILILVLPYRIQFQCVVVFPRPQQEEP